MNNIHIDSQYRDNGSNENFIVNLRNANNLKSNYIAIKSVQIPYTFYGIRRGNNNYFTVEYSNASTKQIFVSPNDGNVSSAVMITNLLNQMNINTAGPQIFTITLDSATGRLTFNSSATYSLYLNTLCDPNTYKVLGFEKQNYNVILGGALTGTRVINMTPERYINIKSNMSSQSDYDNASNGYAGIVCKVPLNGNFFSNISHIEDNLTFRPCKELNNVNFSLFYDDNTPVNLNGHDWSITLVLK